MADPTVDSHSEISPLANRLTPESIAAIERAGKPDIVVVENVEPFVPRASGDLTFQQFSKANRARCESPQGFGHQLNGWSASDWMTALVGEVGEAANVVKKLNRVRDGIPGNKITSDELRDQLRRELGDVFVYLDLMSQALGFSIADAAAQVFDAKSVEIGYPHKLSR